MSNISVAVAPVQTGLVPTNPQVVAVAKNFGWKPEVIIKAIEKHLPAPVEQMLYLNLTAELCIHPRTMQRWLREYSDMPLTEHDLQDKHWPGNMVTNKGKAVAEYLQLVIELTSKFTEEQDGFRVSKLVAAKLVMAYGDQCMTIVDSLLAHKDEICERFRWRDDASYLTKAINFFVNRVLKERFERGLTNPLDILEVLEHVDDELACKKLRSAVGEGEW